MNLINQFLTFKSEEEKKDILHYLNKKELYIKDLTLESLINVISAAKSNLNEELKELVNHKPDSINSRVYTSVISARNEKINKLIDLYNKANTYNKIEFKNNLIEFDEITTIDNVKIEIEDFNYDTPINFKILLYCYDGEIINKNIIPYNYFGLYTEYIDLTRQKETKSIFNVANKDNIYFYSCSYSDKRFEIGNEMNLKKNKDYSFDNEGKVIFDKDSIQNKQFVIKYQPNENAYELTKIMKKVYKIEIIVNDDKMSINDKLKKRLVLFNE